MEIDSSIYHICGYYLNIVDQILLTLKESCLKKRQIKNYLIYYQILFINPDKKKESKLELSSVGKYLNELFSIKNKT